MDLEKFPKKLLLHNGQKVQNMFRITIKDVREKKNIFSTIIPYYI